MARSIRTHGVGLLHHRTEAGIPELDLHQMRADDAEDAIDRFVNHQVMEGADRVKIIHGHGKGVMKRVLEQWCARHPELVTSRQNVGPAIVLELIDIGGKYKRY